MSNLTEEINKLYKEVLKRTVDTHGLLHYTEKVNNDKWSLQDVKKDLLNSKEKKMYDVRELYKTILYREPDTSGMEFYINSDYNINEIRYILENSEEKMNNKNSFLSSYINYYKQFPLKLSNVEYQQSIEFIKSINEFYINSFHRQMDNVNKFYYQLLYFNNKNSVSIDIQNYKSRVENGRLFAKNNNVIIAGLLRDKEFIIPYLKEKCYELVGLFSDYRILIVENDSQDDTRNKLLEWSNNDNRVFILGNGVNAHECKLNYPKTPCNKPADSNRIGKMSFLRNIYLDYIKNNFSNFSFLFVLDMDLKGDLFIDSVCESISFFKNKTVDGITCNGMEKYHYHYYDSFAFVELGQPFIWNTENEKTEHDQYIFRTKTKAFTENMRVVRVTSAFGGFCIYRLSSIINLRYNFSPDKYSCEHAHLNKYLKNFYINPRMIFSITENS